MARCKPFYIKVMHTSKLCAWRFSSFKHTFDCLPFFFLTFLVLMLQWRRRSGWRLWWSLVWTASPAAMASAPQTRRAVLSSVWELCVAPTPTSSLQVHKVHTFKKFFLQDIENRTRVKHFTRKCLNVNIEYLMKVHGVRVNSLGMFIVLRS